jgi:hypothetical protein
VRNPMNRHATQTAAPTMTTSGIETAIGSSPPLLGRSEHLPEDADGCHTSSQGHVRRRNHRARLRHFVHFAEPSSAKAPHSQVRPPSPIGRVCIG